ncbi:MAG: SMEK domain-containing protein [Desulfobacteraceae bacterium]|nr:SMEK domain-containing protein [Desulfobacteraceae bacterium]
MNQTKYYSYIEEKLHIFANRIATGGKLNMLSLHMHSENFYQHLFNVIYSYNLENLNARLQNVEAIDLVDDKNKIIIQVSSTNTKQKVESALSKKIMKKYLGYTFKFISIANDASNLRKKNFVNPHGISFTPSVDIYDITSILRNILNMDVDGQKMVYEQIKKELGGGVDIVKLDSNLATIINILSKEQWDEANKSDRLIRFEVNRKISYNDLASAKDTIDEYVLYHGRVDAKYSEFDSLGNNKSNSVLATMKRTYLNLKNNRNSDEIFYSVIEEIKNKILVSANYIHIPIDELELCVDILVVDAFIRCKILENPEGYNYAAS